MTPTRCCATHPATVLVVYQPRCIAAHSFANFYFILFLLKIFRCVDFDTTKPCFCFTTIESRCTLLTRICFTLIIAILLLWPCCCSILFILFINGCTSLRESYGFNTSLLQCKAMKNESCWNSISPLCVSSQHLYGSASELVGTLAGLVDRARSVWQQGNSGSCCWHQIFAMPLVSFMLLLMLCVFVPIAWVLTLISFEGRVNVVMWSCSSGLIRVLCALLDVDGAPEA